MFMVLIGILRVTIPGIGSTFGGIQVTLRILVENGVLRGAWVVA